MILQAIHDPEIFGRIIGAESWSAWHTFLKALFACPFDFDEADIERFQKFTGRTGLPPRSPGRIGNFSEVWAIKGRRGGGTLVVACCAAFLGVMVDWSANLNVGELPVIALIASDRRQAGVLLRYIKGILSQPLFQSLIVNETKESVEIQTEYGYRLLIEVQTCSFRSTRGRSYVCALLDEVAFFATDENAANVDVEVLRALRPALATFPSSILIAISSPYGKKGVLWNSYVRHWGKNDSQVLVWKADSKSLNPTLPQHVIDEAIADDPISAASEYGAEFRSDISGYIDPAIVAACVIPGRTELPYVATETYRAFVDPSGGSVDSMVLGISHNSKPRGGQETVVIDKLIEEKAPFDPEKVVESFAAILKAFHLTSVTGDRYGGEWCRSSFRRHGISYELADQTKNALYGDFLPLLNSKRVALLDNPRAISQIVNLERRTGRGSDIIDHPPGGHDDLANVIAGSSLMASRMAYVELGGIY